jgi:hypothetical protein
METTIFLMLLILFWTLARCGRILGDLVRDLQRIETRRRKRLLDALAECQKDQFGRN